MAGVTCIREADWIVAWDRAAGGHCYLQGADLAFSGNTIDFVGPRYGGPADTEIDGAGLCVMPGLISLHTHPTNQPITRGVREELGNPAFHMSALYDRTGLWRADDDGLLSGAEAAYGEMLKSGVTTAVDYAARAPEGWIELMAKSGLRIYAAPSFRDADWEVTAPGRLEYHWDEAAGRRAFEQALSVVEQALAHPCGRLGGVIAPGQVDTCTPDTLRESLAVARGKGLPWQTHAAQTVAEYHEISRRHGATPIGWLDRIGVLAPDTTIAHGIFVDSHSWIDASSANDIATLAAAGANVAHCPVVFSRYGQCMESFGGYLRAGINIGIGMDSAPHNMVEEMRAALIMSRTAARHIDDLTTADVFNAATIGGARALLRDDIGRLSEGARADMVLLDLEHPNMRPLRDPLRSLVYTAADRAVRHVYVDGAQVLRDFEVLTLDLPAALERLQSAQQRAEQGVAALDAEGRAGGEISPPVFPNMP